MTGAQLNIANGVREFARATPDAIAVIDGDRRLDYAALDDRSSRLAQALLAAGLAPGDPVAVLSGNRLEYCEIAAGLAKAGMPMVPLNPRQTLADTAYIAGHCDPKAIILDPALEDRAVDPGFTLRLGAEYEAAIENAAATDPAVRVDEHDPFCIAYTSGTTGAPKGVLISHRSRVLTFYCTALEWGLGPGRRTIAVAPMYHGAGFAFAYAAVFTGGTVSMLRAWDPQTLLRMVERDRPQSVFLVPTHAVGLREVGLQGKLDSLETLYFNAAALPVALKEWVLDSFPGVGVHELYGSTEAGVVTDLRPVDARRKAGSVGHPWFMTEIRVVDDEGHPVPPGTPGELYSRSPFLMNGYLGNPAATAGCTTPDGFLTSGDVVVVDDEGFVTIVDRKKDMIITGGVNVYPRDVEEALAAHPAVVEAAVVGERDDRWGERIVAYVVAREEGLEPGALLEHLRPRLAGHKVPKEFRMIAALPRNAAGKVLKRELRSTG
ncbi:AMP-binding protein [Dactylosporangium sp. AC04546]|uniref:class I adenylate-forming enzyme family protein n=1 Tax=Dactylosporangium sp. AC04546 TaxID=2862460 RepID=UPI001EDF19ED|nr:AMP-binding protein [Dactylosporangium sp. AC04546]WVK81450.1 AMP-binding protein [Dactylosporangium sp. AC04546]